MRLTQYMQSVSVLMNPCSAKCVHNNSYTCRACSIFVAWCACAGKGIHQVQASCSIVTRIAVTLIDV